MDPSSIACAPRLELSAVPGIPIVQPGDDVAALVCDALAQNAIELRGDREQRDVLVVTSKIISRAEDRFVDLTTVDASDDALQLARQARKDPRVCELILRESSEVSRVAPNVLIVRHRLGFVSANAGVDESNGRSTSDGRGPWVLLLPRDPDASARAIRAAVHARFGVDVGVVITDSHGRPFRLGSVGVAIGVAGVPALWDHRGRTDLQGRALEITITALADQIAAAADLVAGQADEGRPLVLVRGLRFTSDEQASTSELLRPVAQDLYR
jgi:coenzyme F420-0:L-glutamate ligase/coenzyme F420-1:gamma-L-glutamate ligase